MFKIHSSHPGNFFFKRDSLTGGNMDPFLKSMYVWELEFGQGDIIGYVGFNFFRACGLINCITFNLMMRYRPQCWINPGSNPSWIELLIPCGHLLEFSFKLIWSGNQMLRTGPITISSALKGSQWFFLICGSKFGKARAVHFVFTHVVFCQVRHLSTWDKIIMVLQSSSLETSSTRLCSAFH